MIVKLLTEHHLEFLSLKGGCRGSSESTLVKMSHCWKSHALAQISEVDLGRGKLFTASIVSVDSLYLSVCVYCTNLHQFLILCSSKAMMFVKLYFRTSDIYTLLTVRHHKREPRGQPFSTR